MGIGELFSQNWFNLLSAVGIIGGLYFTAVSFRSEVKTRRVANLLILTQNHQRLWEYFHEHANLARVLDASADIATQPVTEDENGFVVMAIQQLFGTFECMKSGLTIKPEGLRRDISEFFSLPIPKAVWRQSKPLQNQDFAAFVESSLK